MKSTIGENHEVGCLFGFMRVFSDEGMGTEAIAIRDYIKNFIVVTTRKKRNRAQFHEGIFCSLL